MLRKRWYQDSATVAGVAAALLASAGVKLDAGETALFARQLTHLVTKLQETRYPELRARDFIPVDGSINPGADSFVWRGYDWAGMAKIISDYATDLPTIQVVGGEVAQGIKTLGVSYEYSVQELAAASMAGYAISLEKARLARRANENAIEQLAAFGNPSENLPGFLNNANIPTLTIVGFTGDWPTATGEEMLADLNAIANAVVTTTLGIWIPDTLLLPISRYSLVMTKPYSTTVPTPVGRLFLDQSPYVRNIDQWSFLNTADAELDGPRAVIYKRDPDVVQFVIPQEFTQLPPQPRGLAFSVPCYSRIGGVSVKNPLGAAYVDGI